MKSIFGDLDQLIEQAVAKATKTEKSMQKKQEKSVIEQDLDADKKDKKEEVEEAEDDSKKDDGKGDESVEKLKGKGEATDSKKSSGDSEKVSGTKTSKKLNDPSEKVFTNPKFDDIRNKVNALRGSGSLSDKEIASSVQSYLGGLTKAEKSALLTYLTNLSQIMATVKKPDQVKNPKSVGLNINFSGKQEKLPKEKGEVSSKDSGVDSVIVVGDK